MEGDGELLRVTFGVRDKSSVCYAPKITFIENDLRAATAKDPLGDWYRLLSRPGGMAMLHDERDGPLEHQARRVPLLHTTKDARLSADKLAKSDVSERSYVTRWQQSTVTLPRKSAARCPKSSSWVCL